MLGRPLYRPLPRLQTGARVRIVSPSGPVNRERFERGIEVLRAWGLELLYDEGVFARTDYLAGDDNHRRAALTAALADPYADAIWCARGGYGATRLLTDFTPVRVAERPRWLVGFSDVTALHALWQRAGLQSLHAANVTGLAGWSDAALAALYGWLFEGTLPPLAGTGVSGDRPVRGPVLGGNLTVFAALAGTGFLPDPRGAIVFFEDIAERPYRLDRSLTQLVQAGAFTGVAGFAIGQLTNCVDPPDQENGRGALDAIHRVLRPLDVPILAGLPVGHERGSLPLPLGAEAVLDPQTGELRWISGLTAG